MGTIKDISDSARFVMERLHLRRDEAGELIETPEIALRRVADHVAGVEETDELKKKWADLYYDMMYHKRFLPNTPALTGAGSGHGQLAACFVVPVKDSMAGIFDAIKSAALIQQTGGGCIAGDSRIWTTKLGLSTIEDFVEATKAPERLKETGDGYERYDITSLECSTIAMSPAGMTGLKPVTEVWGFDVPAEDQLVITTRQGARLQTSKWHPFMVVDSSGTLIEKRADALSAGDVIISPEVTEDIWPIKDLVNYDGLCIDTNIGWLTGFTLGNGSFGTCPRTKEAGARLRWFSGTTEVLDKVRAILADYGINIAPYKDTRGECLVLTTTSRSQDIVKNLYSICASGVSGEKEGRIRVPRAITISPLPVIYSFIAGLLESDGTVDQDGSPHYYTVSRGMADDLTCLLSLLGFTPNMTEKAPGARGKQVGYAVRLCLLSEVYKLNKLIGKYLVSPLKKYRLNSSVSCAEYMLDMSYQEWKPLFTKLGLAGTRGNPSPCKNQFSNWASAGKLSRRSLRKIAVVVGEKDNDLAELLMRTADCGDTIVSVTQADEPKHYYDLSVADYNTYATGSGGMSFIHNTGFSFSNLREKDALVKSTNGRASGPVTFMAVFDAATETIRQGGTRRGANLGCLRVDHPDILDFISCKKDNNTLTNFNISVALTDDFMAALKEKKSFALISPSTGEVVKEVDPEIIWNAIAEHAHKNGEPGIIFIDTINHYNPTPYIGKIESTNPCGEVPLLPYEACVLGSINLVEHVDEKNCCIDTAKLELTVKTATRFLDDVITASKWPLPEIKESVGRTRKIGLGIMGWADILIKLGISYDSDEAVSLADNLMTFINDIAYQTSIKLGKEKGTYPAWQKQAEEEFGPRNATRTCIAPTGTISRIFEVSSGIEPIFALCYTKHLVDGPDLVFVNDNFIAAISELGLSKEKQEEILVRVKATGSCQDIDCLPKELRDIFKISTEISPEAHVKMQAAFQKHTNNAVSKTCILPQEATVEDVKNIYQLAFDLGLKGITVYRNKSREVEAMSIGTKSEDQVDSEAEALIAQFNEAVRTVRKRTDLLTGTTKRIQTGCGKLYVTLNEDKFGPAEVFLNHGMSGTCVNAWSQMAAIMFSISLRSGLDVPRILPKLRNIRCPNPCMTSDGAVLSCPAAIAMTLTNMLTKKGEEKGTEHAVVYTGYGLCPDCNSPLVADSGCAMCPACGYSRCG